MAVGRKPTDYHPQYRPDEHIADDLNLDQIHRFTQVANKKEHKIEEQQLEQRLEAEIKQAIAPETGQVKPSNGAASHTTRTGVSSSHGHRLSSRIRRKKKPYLYAIMCILVLVLAVRLLFG